jgi:glycosyltransferase involved in cell wall biosynthesis
LASIHQLTAGFAKGDAISNQVLAMRRIFRSWGCASDIFSERGRILPELRGDAYDASEAGERIDAADIAILHLSIGSPVNEIFSNLPCKKVIYYHNITPPRFFEHVQKRTAEMLRRGRDQARALSGIADVNAAVSAFNARELVEMGYDSPSVVPLVLDLNLVKAVNRNVRRPGSPVTVLSVGRCAPNKRIEHSLLAFAYLQRYVQPNSRFVHVGSYAGTEAYYHVLRSMIRSLELENVQFTGSVSQDELNEQYGAATIFLCMSEHEGFCIPVLESMVHDVPVIAYAAGAIPDTMDTAGVLVIEKEYETLAELINRVADDETVRSAILASQRQRIARYQATDVDALLRDLLKELM